MTIESNPPIQQYRRKTGELRMLAGNQILALARKEFDPSDLLATAKRLNAVSRALNAQVKMAKIVIREAI